MISLTRHACVCVCVFTEQNAGRSQPVVRVMMRALYALMDWTAARCDLLRTQTTPLPSLPPPPRCANDTYRSRVEPLLRLD